MEKPSFFIINHVFTVKKIGVIVGATGVGKSACAVQVARCIGGAIVSADSRQVYKELSIGSDKIKKGERMGVPHYGLSYASIYDGIFSSGAYTLKAKKDIADIYKNKCFPLIVGGSIFYLTTLLFKNSFTKIPPNPLLRGELEKLSYEELKNRFLSLSGDDYSHIDIHNPRRIIRAIEILTSLGYIPLQKKIPRYDSLIIGVELPQKEHEERIKKRLMKSWDGTLNEVKILIENGVDVSLLLSLGLQYEVVTRVIKGEYTEREGMKKLLIEILRYARIQKKRFRTMTSIWVHPDNIKELSAYFKDGIVR